MRDPHQKPDPRKVHEHTTLHSDEESSRPPTADSTQEADGDTGLSYPPPPDLLPTDVAALARPASQRAEAPPPEIPGYEILGVLGRGGMGVVYLARDLRLKRRVAVKMILGGAAMEEELVRFRAEAETLARLAHPNIVQVYEVGEAAGRPYIALELVEGKSLAARLRESPLSPRAAAELIETLARAVEAAHREGVIHRDLKPGNVLMAFDGAPKITDFGLAKRLDDPGVTRTGAVMGTPSYMAPEQAEGRRNIGPAADVYALGAMLYESLTGRPPFRGPTTLETLEQVRWQDPVRPRVLQPATPKDLETICLKCLRKDPDRRYAGARELADDVRRYLEGRPIAARPVPRWERALKWARRRPAAAALMAAVFLGVALAAAGAWKYNADLTAEIRAKEARYEQALEAAETLNREVAEVVRPLAGTGSPRVEQILRSAAEVYDRLLAEEVTPRALAGKARMLNAFADLYLEMNDSARAQAAADEALAIHHQLAQQQPRNLTFQRGLAESHERRGDALRVRSTLAEALAEYQRSEAIRRRLAEGRPRDPAYQHELARALSRIGSLYYLEGDLTRAGAAFEEAYGLAAQAGGKPTDPIDRRRHVGLCNEKLGDILFEYADTNDKLDDVLKQYRAALAIYRELAEREPSNTELRRDAVRVATSIGETRYWQSRLEEAQAEMARSHQMAEIEVQHNPTHKVWRQELIRVRIAQAMIEQQQDPSRAGLERQIALHDELISLLREMATQDPANKEWSGRRASALAKQGDLWLKLAALSNEPQSVWKSAAAAADEALRLAEPLLQRDPDERATRMAAVLAHHIAASARKNLQQPHEAATHWNAALEHLAWLRERNRLAPYEKAYVQQFQAELDGVASNG